MAVCGSAVAGNEKKMKKKKKKRSSFGSRRWQRERERERLTGEAALEAAGLGVEDAVDAAQAARAELVVVGLVAGGGAGEHDVVAVLAAGRAVLVLLRVVLATQTRAGDDRVRLGWPLP